MSLTLRTIVGTNVKPDGTPLGGRGKATLTRDSYTSDHQVVARVVYFDVDAEYGEYSVDLWANDEGEVANEYMIELPGQAPRFIVVPAAGAPAELEMSTLFALYVGPSDPDFGVLRDYVDTHMGGYDVDAAVPSAGQAYVYDGAAFVPSDIATQAEFDAVTLAGDWTEGDLLYASGARQLARRAAAVVGMVLLSAGLATAPVWGKVTNAHADLNIAAAGSDGLNTVLGAGAGAALAGATISGASDGSNNTIYGAGAGAATTTGKYCTFIGRSAGAANTTGQTNTFIGMNAGQANTTATGNTFVGQNAGRDNITGEQNTLIGLSAGRAATTGSYNVCVGVNAGRSLTIATFCTYVGFEAGFSATTGEENSCFGMYAGRDLTVGTNNTLLGSNAGRSTTSAQFNVMIGSSSGFNNLTGDDNVYIGQSAGRLGTAGHSNVFVGREAGMNNTGDGGTFIGIYAGTANTSALHNTLIGGYAGADLTTGGTNTFIGFGAGRGVTTGTGNTIIGANVEGLSAALTNNVILADGNGLIRAQATLGAWTLTHTIDGLASSMFFGASGNTRFGYAGGAASIWMHIQATKPLAIGTFSGVDLTLGTNNTSRVVIAADTGYVSISAEHMAVGGTAIDATCLLLPAATSSKSSIRLPHGAAPSAALADGDVWTTTAGMFVRINGVTKQVQFVA